MAIKKSELTKLKRLVEEVISEREEGADKMYKDRRKEIDVMVKTLQASFKKMDAKQKKDPKNWGYTGNLGKIADDMEEIIRFVSRS